MYEERFRIMRENLNIFVVNPFGNSKGHSQYYSTSICNSLSKSGLTTFLYTSEDYNSSDLNPDVLVTRVKGVRNVPVTKDLNNVFKSIIYGLFIVVGTFKVLRKCKKELIRSKNSVLYLIGGELLISLIFILIFEIPSKKVLTIHNADFDKEIYPKYSLKRIYKSIGKYLLKRADEKFDKYIVHGSAMQFEFIRQFEEINSGKVDFLNLGVDRNFLPHRSIGESHENINLLLFGVLRRDKGVFELIDTLGKLRRDDLTLYITGSFGQISENELYESIKQADIKKNIVLKLGYVEETEISEIFFNADFVILPYHSSFRAQSVVVTMAASFNRAVICSDTGQNGYDVRKFNTGFLYRADDYEDLLRILQNLKRSDVYSFEQGISDYCDAFSWDNFGKYISTI